MKLARGDIVILHVPTAFNGSHEVPAIVTNGWGDSKDTRDGPVMVNCTALPDCSPSLLTYGSVKIRQEKPETPPDAEGVYGWLRERDRLADAHPVLASLQVIDPGKMDRNEAQRGS